MSWLLTIETEYFAAFIVGLMGGVHCLGMCGGIVTAFSFNSSSQTKLHFLRLTSTQISYNLGRISSYTLIGFIAGLLGATLNSFFDYQAIQTTLGIIAGLFMIAIGFYLAGWWLGVAKVETIGKPIWRYLEPLGRHFIPIKTSWQALLLGLIWGWLPCGLVYSVLLWPVASSNPWDGALIMLCFGLGTLPNLLLIGAFATQLKQWLHKAWVKQLAGALVVSMGVLLIIQIISL